MGISAWVSADSILFIKVLNGPSAQTDCIPVDVKAKNILVPQNSYSKLASQRPKVARKSHKFCLTLQFTDEIKL